MKGGIYEQGKMEIGQICARVCETERVGVHQAQNRAAGAQFHVVRQKEWAERVEGGMFK